MEDRDDRSHGRLPHAKMKEVHKAWGLMEADIIKSFLESQGIPCFLQADVPHSIYPFSIDGLGEVRIFVNESDFETAKELIENRAPDQEKE